MSRKEISLSTVSALCVRKRVEYMQKTIEELTIENANLRKQHEVDEKVMRKLATRSNCDAPGHDWGNNYHWCDENCSNAPYKSESCVAHIIESVSKEVGDA